MPRLTITEIAKMAEVSPAAVSIVLNNKKGVSDETRRKVTEIVERLQYTPNPNSRRLLLNKTNNIAVLFKKNISPLEHFFHSEINNAILHECEALGYNLLFTSASVENDNVILSNVIKAYDVDGIIFYGDMDSLVINSIKKYEIPYIIVDSHSPNTDSISVSADYEEATRTAVKHLIELGHTDIAYIGNNSLQHYSVQTFNGFKKCMEEKCISIPMNWVQIDAHDEASSYDCMKNILTGNKIPTAVFCCADIYAIGAVKCIKENGFKIPDDISVASVDDIILSQYIEPPLTTVKIDKVEMAKIAMHLLIKKIEKENVESLVLKSDNLIIRSSTKPLK
jgi:DNA-binding LacI/PurR family transcriptional regulator